MLATLAAVLSTYAPAVSLPLSFRWLFSKDTRTPCSAVPVNCKYDCDSLGPLVSQNMLAQSVLYLRVRVVNMRYMFTCF